MTTPLSAAETQKLLARLPKIDVKADDAQPFAMRDKSLPAPRPGDTVHEPFPPPQAPEPPPAVESGPLRVLRHGPEGDVQLAPRVSVTFSQPMVPVTDHATLAAIAVPVQIAPAIAGEWRWLGTQTAIFQPKVRLPMATEYAVVVPAGTKSQTGGALDKEHRFTFRTPPPRVLHSTPSGHGLPLNPVIFAEFDQAVSPAAIAAKVTVRANGSPVPFQVLTADDLEKESGYKWRVQALKQDGRGDRWVALRAQADLPKDSAIAITWGPGLPSAEGPRTSATAVAQSFRTYGPLRLTGSQCGWGDQCPPLQPWYLTFSNALDAKVFDPALVQVTPPVPGMQVVVSGTQVTISGQTKGNTKYTVHIGGDLTDTYAQKLGKPATATFKTSRAEPAMQMQLNAVTVLDPAQKSPHLSVWSVNQRLVRLQAWRVDPNQWWAWNKAQKDRADDDRQPRPPGELALDKLIGIKGEPDEVTETLLDLHPALKGDRGHLIVHVQPVPQPKEKWRQVHYWGWVQVTRLGLTAVRDGQGIQFIATDLATGKPGVGARIEVREPAKTLQGAAADGDGRWLYPLPDSADKTRVAVAQLGNDVAMLPERDSYWQEHSDWHQSPPGSHTVWHVVDDRGLYKPGETANLKGWLRTIVRGPAGDVQAWSGAGTLYWKLRDARGNDVGKGTLPVAQGGSFDLQVALPKNLHLGTAQVIFGYGPDRWDFSHHLRVEEFRRPEFETTTQADPGPYAMGDHALVTTSARYYAGGALPSADVRWDVRATSGAFAPAGWSDWTFGRPIPWWMRWYRSGGGVEHAQNLQSRLGSTGQHVVRIDFDAGEPIQPWAVTAHATVYDVNRQAWTTQAHLVVHPAALYAGLKTDKGFAQAGEALPLDIVATDLDGKAVAGVAVAVHFFRNKDVQKQGVWSTERTDVQTCNWTSTAKPGQCTFTPKAGGLWHVEATLTDAKGRKNQTALQIYVSGPDSMPDRNLPEDQVQLVPDRQQYAPGQTAKLLVLGPWPDATGELTVAREGVLWRKPFKLAGRTATLEIPIEDAHTPNLVAHVTLLGQAPRKGANGLADPKLQMRPAFASNEVSLPVPPDHRTLQVRVSPQHPDAMPGQKTALDVQVTDAQGKPAADAELLVVMADEAVLALTGYRIPSPIGAFYPQRGSGLSTHELRQWILLSAGPQLEVEAKEEEAPGKMRDGGGRGGYGVAESAPSGGGSYKKGMVAVGAAPPAREPMAAPAMPGERMSKPKAANGHAATTGADAPDDDKPAPAIALRKDFNPLAVFAPVVRTDAQGRAKVEVTLPDNLTRYRVMAVAAHDVRRFGLGEATVVARLPLMVRPSAPRFANFGDEFQLPVVLQNQTPNPLDVQLAARSSVLQVAGLGLRLTIPGNDRVEVRLPTTAPQAGTGRVQIAVATGAFSDAAEISLPVWTPATTEAFATYGVLDSGARAQPIRAPKNAVKQYGGLQVTTSSTALQGLTDAVLYLLRYPFECSEQRASRVLSIAALRDVLQAFKVAELPSDAELAASMAADFKALERTQNYDGGWGFWKKGEQSWPVTTLHVTHALVRAKAKGYAVPGDPLRRALDYLRSIESRFPSYYGVQTRQILRAEALYVRLVAGERDIAKARALVGEFKDLQTAPMELLGWTWPVLVGDRGSAAQLQAIRTHVQNRAEETAGAAHFTVRYDDGAHLLLASDRRADAILLDALMTDDAKADLIPKLVTGLLAHRKKGRWGSTQENAWVLLALDRYFRTYEKATPDFVARLWLGDQYAGEQAFKGRSTDRHELRVPMALLQAGPADRNLIVGKQGDGRLYYRIGLDYAPADLRLPPMDRGFFVQRTYEAVDKPDDVKRLADGTWQVKAGARVRVHVDMVAPARRYHVALVDPMPAGLEAINGDLLGSEPPPDTKPQASGSARRWWWGRWYEHDNLRDERAEAFTSLLWEGEWQYVYLCRATTPGRFVVPPAKAEEMYSPEVFGRSGVDFVVVR
ncbi:MAG: hypothetical protein FJ100_14910 [Deltaproteobacteria bacterium]|nr:hypothetical protein [Deltaproteobacteria bacterium]